MGDARVQEYRYALSAASATSYLLLPSSKTRQRVIDISDVEFTFIKAHYLLSHILDCVSHPMSSTLSKIHGIHTNSSPLYHVLHQVHFVIETLFCQSCNPRHLAISLYSLS